MPLSNNGQDRPGKWSARAAVTGLMVAGLFASQVSVMSPVTAQATTGVADFVPDTALFYSEFELDQKSDQVVKGAELLDRANLSALLTEDDMSSVEAGLSGIGGLISGDGGVFLTDIPVDDSVTLDAVASDASEVTSDPMSAVGGDVPDGWTVVLHPDDAEFSYDLYLNLLTPEDDSAPAPEEVEYNGYTIVTQPAADESSTPFSIALVDDVIALATTPDDIEPVIDTATGDADALADSDEYNNIRGQMEADVLMFGFVNGPALFDALSAQDPATADMIPSEYTSTLSAYQGWVFWADDPGFRLDTIAVPANGSDIPAAEAFEPAFTSNIPATSLFYSGGTDLGQTPGLDALALIVAQEALGIDTATATPAADPEAHADQVFADAADVIGFNIKTDVLDQLVGEWAVAGSASNLASTEPDVSGLFVSEVADSATAEDVIATITDQITQQGDETIEITSREIEGSTVTVVTATDSVPPMVIEYGVVDDKVFIGVNGAIDDFLGEQAEPLADDANFAATFAELPAEASSISYLNVQAALPLIEDAIAMSSDSSMLDNDPSCGDYATQEEAQAALDEDNFENYSLDLDWDGEACEDFFAPVATPEATPTGVSDINVLSIGSVTTSDGKSTGTHTIILIGE